MPRSSYEFDRMWAICRGREGCGEPVPYDDYSRAQHDWRHLRKTHDRRVVQGWKPTLGFARQLISAAEAYIHQLEQQDTVYRNRIAELRDDVAAEREVVGVI